MLEFLAILFGFAAVFLVVIGIQSRPGDPVEARLRAVQAGIRPPDPMLAHPFIQRAAAPVAGWLARMILKLLPVTWIKSTERMLVIAGSPISLPGFVVIWTGISLLVGVFSFIFAGAFGFGFGVQIIAGLIGLAIGAYVPQLWLKIKVSERNYYARKGLPDAMDLMLTSVEAGLSLDAAMVRVAEYHQSPFQVELERALQDMSLGMSRRDALEGICERLDIPEVVTFIQAINQAEVTGAPIGRVLRVQAEQIRIKRRQSAEAQANRAPVLMIFPLVFFIFPSIFVVLLAPAILTMVDILTNNDVFTSGG